MYNFARLPADDRKLILRNATAKEGGHEAINEEDIWNALSEKTNFILTPEQWDEFVKLLDNPPESNPALDKTLNTIPPWERD